MNPNFIKQTSPPGRKATSAVEPTSLDREESIRTAAGPIPSPRQYGGLLMALSATGVAVAAVIGIRDGATAALGIIVGTCVLVLLVWLLAIRRPG
jgi:hypothetical protein